MTIFREAADTKQAKRCHRVSMAASCTLLAAWLTACASPQYNYSPNLENFSIPAVGSIKTITVGESLLMQGLKTEADAIHVAAPVTVDRFHVITEGRYLKQGEDEKYSTYKATPIGSNNASQKYFTAILIPHDTTKICVTNAIGAVKCSSTPPVTRIKVTLQSNRSYQQTLIYNGRIGNEIKISYRESASGLARTAFSNEATYDATISPFIAYKGARIEVTQADNEKITYKVLSNFVDSDQNQ